MVEWTKERLVAFENRVADAFNAKQIRAPVHLCSDSQADHLIRIFKYVQPQDWCFCSWRNHHHCLLKGVPENELFQAILDGRSMTYCSKEHRIICSSIVGGHLPIAAGVAMGIERRGGDERVWVFCGDMAATTGVYSEFARFVTGHGLPVTVIQEDNGFSTDTPTRQAWGEALLSERVSLRRCNYEYERTRPHVGTGEYVTF